MTASRSGLPGLLSSGSEHLPRPGSGLPPFDAAYGLPLAHRFVVTFFVGGVAPNPIDIRFQRVSGLNATIETRTVVEGGQNLYSHRLPTRASYSNLVLERGVVMGSPLNLEFNAAMSGFKFLPSNVLVSLLSEAATPLMGWMFFKAYPVRWSTADLSASEDKVLIDTMELAYTRMQILRV